MKEQIDKIVYFDGICGLCDWFVNFLVKIDTNNNLKFSTLQGTSGQVLLSSLKMDLKEYNTVLFKINDQVYTKSTAVFKIIESVGGFYKVFLIFIVSVFMLAGCGTDQEVVSNVNPGEPQIEPGVRVAKFQRHHVQPNLL